MPINRGAPSSAFDSATKTIGVSGEAGGDVKVTLDGEEVAVNDGGNSLTVDNSVLTAALALDGREIRVGAMTAFNQVQVVEDTPVLELDSSNGLSAYRDVQTVTGSGAISTANGLIDVATGATASSTAVLTTAERGRYQPGLEAVAGLGVMRDTAPTGEQEWIAGYYDGTDGVVVGEDATGYFVRHKVGGTWKDKVRQDDWNGELVASGQTLDVSKLTIFRTRIVWYGAGPLIVEAKIPDGDGVPQLVTLHRFSGTAGEPILEQPKLPIYVGVENGATTSDLTIRVGGRQFHVVGRYDPQRRITSQSTDFGTTVGTSEVPLVSFRKKSGDTAKSVKVQGFGFNCDNLIKIRVYLGTTLSAGTTTFGSVTGISADETCLETNTAATAFTGGNVIYEGIGGGGGNNKFTTTDFGALSIDIPDDTTITLAAVADTAGSSIVATFRLEEEW